MKNNLLFVAVLALFALIAAPAAPAAAVSIFADGFEGGTTCAWSSGGTCIIPTFIGDDASVVNGSTAEYEVSWSLENVHNGPVFQSKVMCRDLNTVNCGMSFTIRKADGTIYTGGVMAVQLSSSNSALDSPTHWGMAGNGADRPFSAFIALNNTNGTVGSYRARVEGVSYAFDSNDMVGDRLLTMGYQTDLVNLLNVQPLGDQTEALLDALPYPLWKPDVETFIETAAGSGVFNRITQ
ncbi:MAG: hypothetical protein RLY47_518 [Candidatus Parcubacteria bacterium]|jgi:hypothetical protein